MTYLIHATVLSGLPKLITELGGDPDALFRAHGIDPATVDDFDSFVRYADSAAVLGDVARTLGATDIGLRLADRQNLQVLGPLAVMLYNSATVGDAIDGACRFLHNIVAADTIKLTRTETAAIYSFDTLLNNDLDRQLMVEKSLALAMKGFDALVGGGFVPLKVTFQHSAMAALSRYDDVFVQRPQFGAAHNRIDFPLSVLNRPIRDRDRIAHALAESHLTQVRPGVLVTEQVRGLTRRLLAVNEATLADVARAVAMHPRAVQRHLAEEGTTFEKILDDVRRERAWEMSGTGMSVAHIARALGYAEQSSYTRACRRWFGETPKHLQVRVREGRRALTPA
ncbi:AraC family transcriptional regulator [Gordonia sp. TBRC 11910]|uniref:AraC family transcriptional regulator n=1 Tax=Gordonia asplenii TaxID=2725283 RepID=A0A848L2C2_9ACTN|nr:AraC family transcriptional regulator [Gordonia asplenii]NMO02753.1 AraC family transcriptional regulator [Gordonia asplenii]